MVFWIFPNFTHFIPYPVKVESPVDVLFSIRIDGDLMSVLLHFFNSVQKIFDIPDRSVHKRPDQAYGSVIKGTRDQHPQFRLLTVTKMNTYSFRMIWCLPYGFTESFLNLFCHINDVLAGSEGILTEIGAGTIGVPSLPAPQCNT